MTSASQIIQSSKSQDIAIVKKTLKVSGLVDAGAISKDRPGENMPVFEKKQRPLVESVGQPPSPQLIAVGLISPNPYQPRTVFPTQEMEELANSINEIGLIQPITVRAIGINEYQIVAGERRWRAFKLLGKEAIPVNLIDCNDEDMAIMAISENVDRTDLSDYEICKAIRKIETLFPNRTKLAKALGMIREHLYRYLAFEAMPAFLIERLDANPRIISKFTACEIKRVVNATPLDDMGLAESILKEAIDLIDSNQLDQTKIASHLLASMKARKIGEVTRISKEIYPIANAGNNVGFLQISPNGVTAKIRAGVISHENSLVLQQLISDFISAHSI
jgi:ParB family chromosome partitioning protein